MIKRIMRKHIFSVRCSELEAQTIVVGQIAVAHAVQYVALW